MVWDNAYTSDLSSKGERLAESQVLWCNAHNIRLRVQMAELATLHLMQLVGARFTTEDPINQEAIAPPPLGFLTQC